MDDENTGLSKASIQPQRLRDTWKRRRPFRTSPSRLRVPPTVDLPKVLR